MHIQIINFKLKGVSEQEYYRMADHLAVAFANIPGLAAKAWLANPAENAYGSIYLWESQKAMRAFSDTELFNAFVMHPNLSHITTHDFMLLESPTAMMRSFAG